jgi:hypothetical protein
MSAKMPGCRWRLSYDLSGFGSDKKSNSRSGARGPAYVLGNVEVREAESCMCGADGRLSVSLALPSAFGKRLLPFLVSARTSHSSSSVETYGGICPHLAARFLCHCSRATAR